VVEQLVELLGQWQEAYAMLPEQELENLQWVLVE
jgi:hypothetical protein